MNKQVNQALGVANKFGIKVWDNNTIKSASWSHGKQIEVNLKKQRGAYPILHEIGHVFMGYMCCNEHCEYVAHGFAFGLAKSFNIYLPKSMKKVIDYQAGRNIQSCLATKKNKNAKLHRDTEKI